MGQSDSISRTRRRRNVAILLALGALVALPAIALGHIERASYWPDPAPDTSVSPPAGGAVPAARSLYTALASKPPGTTRVVCQGPASLTRLRKAIKKAETVGYTIRPTQPPIKISKRQGDKLLAFNARLLSACRYREIQPAVTASRNNDRVVIMPGLYTEPTARKQPTNDPKCADLRQQNDRGSSGAVSY